jgi:sugar O-acyltransferase (sialic acid O-acetyltransferase NeuD family)
MSNELIVLGSGGHAKVVIATAQAAGFDVVAVFDDDESLRGCDVLGVPIEGTNAEGAAKGIPAVIGIGSNRVRLKFAEELRCDWKSVIHPHALVHDSVSIGSGTVVMAGVIVQPGVSIGSHVIVNTGASIDHDCVLESGVHVGPGARLCGDVKVGRGSLLGVGSAFIPGVTIGAWCIVGGGAAVTNSVCAHQKLVGVPAKSR